MIIIDLLVSKSYIDILTEQEYMVRSSHITSLFCHNMVQHIWRKQCSPCHFLVINSNEKAEQVNTRASPTNQHKIDYTVPILKCRLDAHCCSLPVTSYPFFLISSYKPYLKIQILCHFLSFLLSFHLE